MTVNTAERTEILVRYAGHARRFDEAAQRRSGNGGAENIPSPSLLRKPGWDLTNREIEVLRLVSDGLANRVIGNSLFISVQTVKSHLEHILAKLGASSRTHAVAIGIRRGLIA